MSGGDLPDTQKVYDAEETRNDTAKRLIRQSLNRRSELTHKLRDRLRLHVRHLSRSDRMALIEWLRRESELTVGLAEDANDEQPEFGFPSDSIDEEWNLNG